MASRTFPGTPRTLDRSVIQLWGRFIGAGAAPVTGVNCLGFTIARTGVGLFTITLDDQYPASDEGTPTSPLLGLWTSRIAAAAVGPSEMQVITDNSANSAKTLLCRYVIGGAAVDVTAADIVMLEITLRNTSTPRNGA